MDVNEQLAEALRHCLAVFKSMADRGAYPLELMPWKFEGGENEMYLGKPGWSFAAEALAAYDSSKRAQAAQALDVGTIRKVAESIDLHAETCLDPQAKAWANKLYGALAASPKTPTA